MWVIDTTLRRVGPMSVIVNLQEGKRGGGGGGRALSRARLGHLCLGLACPHFHQLLD